jgi:hypothetical protein
MLLQPMRGAEPVDGESENGYHLDNSKKRHPPSDSIYCYFLFRLIHANACCGRFFQKPAIKGFRRMVRISEWVPPPGTRICIFAIVCLYPSYPIDRTGKMVRTLFYTYEARDTNVKIYSRKGG